jgi:hypothetical protein
MLVISRAFPEGKVLPACSNKTKYQPLETQRAPIQSDPQKRVAANQMRPGEPQSRPHTAERVMCSTANIILEGRPLGEKTVDERMSAAVVVADIPRFEKVIMLSRKVRNRIPAQCGHTQCGRKASSNSTSSSSLLGRGCELKPFRDDSAFEHGAKVISDSDGHAWHGTDQPSSPAAQQPSSPAPAMASPEKVDS